MAEQKKIVITKEGLKKYEDELHNLKVVRRKEVAEKLKEARAQGDLSENAEYDAAKDEQRDIEARIEQLEGYLKNAEVVSEDEVDSGKVGVGCTVTVLHMQRNKEIKFQIVGTSEVDTLGSGIRKISNESPVGSALNNARVGDVVDVTAPGGTYQYKVLEITRTVQQG